MGDMVKHFTSRVFTTETTPSSAVSIKVDNKSLLSALDSGIVKRNFFDRHIPFQPRRRVHVEAAECGTTDSVFFAPERPNVHNSHERVSAAEFIKVNPNEHNDVVRLGDDFEMSFIGMSVSSQDFMGDNELLLCSLARKEDCIDHDDTHTDISLSATGSSTVTTSPSVKSSEPMAAPVSTPEKPPQTPVEQLPGLPSEMHTEMPVAPPDGPGEGKPPPPGNATLPPVPKPRTLNLTDLPTSLPIRPGDLPFLHYDPETDGHDNGSEPNTFIPIPGTKRLFVQKRASDMGMQEAVRDVVVRFTIMEIDKLSEEQLIAVKSLEEVAKSVGKASNSVPYLKIIAWLLKFANTLGRSALKKVARPDHVLSTDMCFMLAPDDDPNARVVQREEYGNYLRYGYYFFLSSNVDAKLYAQTGASSQNVQLLLRRFKYNKRHALPNEKEFFPLTGMSYAVVKVTRGCSPYNVKERSEMFERHRARLMRLLKKYTGTLGTLKAGADAAEEHSLVPDKIKETARKN